MSAKGEWITVYCEVCGAARELPVYRVRVGKGRWCSRACRGRAMVAGMNEKRPSPKLYAKPPIHRGTDNNKWKGGGTTCTCKHCGQQFKRDTYLLGGKSGHTGDYCSKACRNEYRRLYESGERSPFWVGGPNTYRGRDWRRARMAVVTDQAGVCAECRRFVGDSLPVHHIRPYREFESYEQANERSNLIGLCQSCHMKREPRKTKTGRSSRPEHR